MTASPEIIVGITIMPPKHRDGSENLDVAGGELGRYKPLLFG